ncbi:MAG: acetamidase/formamidase family protein [Bacteroidetes bacterium]|nr:acetamidase/formamidase family protein [Bacteroidota bacterium]
MRNTLICSLLLPLALHAQPKHVSFTPTSFSPAFTLNRPPVLTINPGDTVSTETIDAMGFDQKAVKRSRGGNPLTGPFFITGAAPGDVLVIQLHHVSLNRDYAKTSDYFVSRCMPKEIMQEFKKTSSLVRWRLDLQMNQGWPDSSAQEYPHLKNFKVPLSPFLGCIGVAPTGHKNEILSFFQGPFGGNMDFNRTKTGSTVYLPVFHEGAYLYIGDGHALQGDGEIAGNALETSMDVVFSVQLIKNDSLQYPRVEDNEYIMALGTAKETPEALKLATKNLLDWLQKDYHLTLHEATQVMSTTIEYGIAEIADPNVVVTAKIKKEKLRSINK